MTEDNKDQLLGKDLLVAYYDVDYERNPKGSNYWRNRLVPLVLWAVPDINWAFFFTHHHLVSVLTRWFSFHQLPCLIKLFQTGFQGDEGGQKLPG